MLASVPSTWLPYSVWHVWVILDRLWAHPLRASKNEGRGVFSANESRCVGAYAIGSLVKESWCAAKPSEIPTSS